MRTAKARGIKWEEVGNLMKYNKNRNQHGKNICQCNSNHILNPTIKDQGLNKYNSNLIHLFHIIVNSICVVQVPKTKFKNNKQFY